MLFSGVIAGEQGQQPVAVNTVDNKAGKGAINTAGAGGAAVDAGELSNVSDGSLQAGATSMQLSKVVCFTSTNALLYWHAAGSKI